MSFDQFSLFFNDKNLDNRDKYRVLFDSSCPYTLDSLTEPISFVYSKGYTFIIFAVYNKTPVAVKLSLDGRDRNIQKNELISHSLIGICPNIIKIICDQRTDEKSIQFLLEKFYNHKEEDQLKKDQVELNKLFQVIGRDPILNKESIRELKTKYEINRTELSKYNQIKLLFKKMNQVIRVNNGLSIDYYALYSVAERIASPFNISFYWNSSRILQFNCYRNVCFQIFWALACFQSIGLEHSDFNDRNVWLQPIKKNFKYVQYTWGEKILYLDLAPVDHFLLKIGDFDESKASVGLCQDLKDTAYFLRKMHKKCTDCKQEFVELFNCFDTCHDECRSFSFEKLFALDSFRALEVLPSGISKEEIITPQMYTDPSIVDYEFHL